MTTRRGLVLMAAAAALVVAFLMDLAFGAVSIPLGQVVKILFGGTPDQSAWSTIVHDFRLPKAVTATLSGAALGVGGLQMQTLFRNPLADPFILGISSGASLGVAIVVLGAGAGAGGGLLSGLGFLGDLGVAGAAALGAAAVMGIVLAIARRVRATVTLLIIGLMVGYAAIALVSLLIWSSTGNRVQAYVAWSYGSFGGVTWDHMRVMAPALAAGLVLALATVKQLNAFLLGEQYAASMGVAVKRMRAIVIVSASLLAGIVTAFCGPIAFLGLAVPHLTRGLVGTSDHRVMLPACALVGATVALLASLATNLPGSERVLPLNVVTSLVGAPTVILVLLKSRHASRQAA